MEIFPPRCCQPQWFFNFYAPFSCSTCGTIIVDNVKYLSGCLVIRCFKRNTCHCVAVFFCINNDCEAIFLSRFENEEWEKFCILLPISLKHFKELDKKQHDFVASEAYSLYDNNTQECTNCSIWEPTAKKFQVCSQCEKVRYCSKDCQKEDWSNHKIKCKLYAGIATAEEIAIARPQRTPSNADRKKKYDTEYCYCYDDNDLLYYNASLAEKCVNPDCEKLCSSTQAIDLCIHFTECTKNKPFHIIPYWFCSVYCERKTAGQYKRVIRKK